MNCENKINYKFSMFYVTKWRERERERKKEEKERMKEMT